MPKTRPASVRSIQGDEFIRDLHQKTHSYIGKYQDASHFTYQNIIEMIEEYTCLECWAIEILNKHDLWNDPIILQASENLENKIVRRIERILTDLKEMEVDFITQILDDEEETDRLMELIYMLCYLDKKSIVAHDFLHTLRVVLDGRVTDG